MSTCVMDRTQCPNIKQPFVWALVIIYSHFVGCVSGNMTPKHSRCKTDVMDVSTCVDGCSITIQPISLTSEVSDSSTTESIVSKVGSTEASENLVSIDTLSFGALPPSNLDDAWKGKFTNERLPLFERLANDQLQFYSPESSLNLIFVFGIGATFANTQLDGQIQRHFRSSVLGASTDEWFEKLHASKELGNGHYTLPIFGAAWLASEWIDGPPAFEAVGTWGERSMRGFLVGAGPVLAGQHLTGGSRPSEFEKSSYWHPLQDDNGVSGHAFMSSLPFITAAKMTKNPLAKFAFYTGSTLGPLSRMNDNAHYPSQIGMGWCLAYLSATAVANSNSKGQGWSLKPIATGSGSGLAAEYIW